MTGYKEDLTSTKCHLAPNYRDLPENDRDLLQSSHPAILLIEMIHVARSPDSERQVSEY